MRVHSRLNSSQKHILAKKLPHSFYLLESEQNVRNQAGLDIQNIQSGEKTKEDSSLYKLN
ncbi:hypothetical protein ASC72_02880 [Flavobacterium sp. Root420]|nr:hypothetical protein ASC72_02880 [Flavobacterium sp. Root420]